MRLLTVLSLIAVAALAQTPVLAQTPGGPAVQTPVVAHTSGGPAVQTPVVAQPSGEPAVQTPVVAQTPGGPAVQTPVVAQTSGGPAVQTPVVAQPSGGPAVQTPVVAQTSGGPAVQTPVVAQPSGEPELRALLKAPMVKATGAYLSPDSVVKLQALLKGNLDLVNQPIIQLRGENASTPLLEAVTIGNVDAVRTLLELKAKPNLALSRELPPLQEALINRLPGEVRLTMVRLLLGSGADPTGAFHAWAGCTNWTDRKTYFAAADALAQARGNFSIKNPTGATPLQIAVVCDNVLAVEKLVGLGAKPDDVVNDLAWAGRGTAEGDKIVKLLNLKVPAPNP